MWISRFNLKQAILWVFGFEHMFTQMLNCRPQLDYYLTYLRLILGPGVDLNLMKLSCGLY